jgi:hypothetical protein
MVLIYKPMDDQTLYEQLVNRLYHIERAFIIRRHLKIRYSAAVSRDVREAYGKVIVNYNEFFLTFEETLLWFITVELWSRFTANSKKGLLRLVNDTKNDAIKAKKDVLVQKNKEVIGYIDVQRKSYFAHADDQPWKKFPNIRDDEYETLINDLKKLMIDIGQNLGSQMKPVTSSKPEEDTLAIFIDLLGVVAPNVDIEFIKDQYKKDLNNFLSTSGRSHKLAK